MWRYHYRYDCCCYASYLLQWMCVLVWFGLECCEGMDERSLIQLDRLVWFQLDRLKRICESFAEQSTDVIRVSERSTHAGAEVGRVEVGR